MKQLTFVFVVVLSVVFSAVASYTGKEKEVKIKTSAVCEMCKERIEKNLTLSKGITEAVLNLDDKVVTVKYNPKKTNEAAIRKIITDTGYDADNLQCSQTAHDKLPECCQKTSTAHSH
ncbi:MAG: heavy metal-associated domain-containing protein [Spirosomataceae bacterium]